MLRREWEDLEFKVILCYIASSRKLELHQNMSQNYLRKDNNNDLKFFVILKLRQEKKKKFTKRGKRNLLTNDGTLKNDNISKIQQ